MFLDGLHSIDATRSVGADGLEIAAVQGAPAAAKRALFTLLEDIRRAVAWPAQARVVRTVFIPKVAGGDRGIGVTSTLYAIYGAVYGDPLLEWRECRKAFWDGALRGSSALRMGLLRHMKAEAAVFVGHETLAAFSDF